MPFDPLFPPELWRDAGIHWHAFVEKRHKDQPMRAGDRARRLAQPPETVLWSPWAVVGWIDRHTRKHVHHRKVWSTHDEMWVEIGDENDLDESRHNNYLVATRGDSIYTDVYTRTIHHDLFVEAVTNELCRHSCTPTGHHDDGDADDFPDDAA